MSSDAWQKVELGSLGIWVGGGTPSKSNSAFWKGSIPWVSPKDMKVEVITDAEDHITQTAIRESATNEVPAGAVLVVTRSGILEHSLPVAVAGRAVTVNQDLKALMPGDGVSGEFVAKALRAFAPQILNDCRKAGTTVASLDTERLKAFKVPLPPLGVQRRIVAKLDELLAHSRAARERLEAVPALVEQYRQSVLAAAFSGELTKDWRKKNLNIEPASVLLERIRAERRRQWETAELARITAKGGKPKDDRWKGKYDEPEPVDPSGLRQLPTGWSWARLAELADVRHGFPFESRYFGDDGDIVLTPGNFTPEGLLDFVNKRVVRHTGTRDPAWTLENGDLVTVMTDLSPKKLILGATAIVNSPERILHNQRIGLVVPGCAEVTRRFLRLAMLRPEFRRKIVDSASGTVISHTSPTRLLDGLIPLPPLAEQEVLTQRAEQQVSTASNLGQSTVGAALSVLERALLLRAMRGELDFGSSDSETVPVNVRGKEKLEKAKSALRRFDRPSLE